MKKLTGLASQRHAGARLLVLGLLWLLGVAAAPAGATEQKIVFIRHGEKPEGGLGQLNCQGLNRSLALPAVLFGKFGKPDFVFASDPHDKKPDDGGTYNYIRPLLTIAPTAVQAGLPVNTAFGFEDIAGLRQELALPQYQGKLVFVAWEHKQLEALVRAMLPEAAAQAVPRWKGSDFDSIYVLTVKPVEGQAAVASFALEREQLNGQSRMCPTAAARP